MFFGQETLVQCVWRLGMSSKILIIGMILNLYYCFLQRIYLSLPFGLISDKTTPQDPVWAECRSSPNF